MKNGKILQVMGPVVDVKFEDSDLPYISDALFVMVEDQKRVMEVAQHIVQVGRGLVGTLAVGQHLAG